MVELVKEARFADASVPDNSSDLEFAVFERGSALVLQAFEFRFAPDHGGLNPLDASPQQLKHAWPDLAHKIHRRRLASSFDAKGILPFHLEQPSKLAISVVGNQDGVARRPLQKLAGKSERALRLRILVRLA